MSRYRLPPRPQPLPTQKRASQEEECTGGVGAFATLGGASSGPPESQDTVTCLLDSILIRSSC